MHTYTHTHLSAELKQHASSNMQKLPASTLFAPLVTHAPSLPHFKMPETNPKQKQHTD